MNLVQELFNLLKEMLNTSTGLIKQARCEERYFTRERLISARNLLLYILLHAPGAISSNLIELFGKLNYPVREMPSKQALSQKRKLIDESPFKKIFSKLVGYLYQPKRRKSLATFKDFFVIGIDGTDVDIPNHPKLKENFGTIGRGKTSTTARGSVAMDLLNHFVLDGLLSPMEKGERELAREHLKNLPKILPARQILYVMDRGYFGGTLFKKIAKAGSKFLCRCPIGLCHAIDDARTEDVIFYNGLKLKVFKLILDSGEIEVLVTNCLDLDEHDVYSLYHLRWEIEENYKIIKCHLHLECFNGCLEQVIRQEFFAVLINSLLLSALAQHSDSQIIQREDNLYTYKANRNRCAQAIKRNLVELLTEENEKKLEFIYREMFSEALRDKVPVRPGRHYPRKIKRAVRYHSNIRYN